MFRDPNLELAVTVFIHSFERARTELVPDVAAVKTVNVSPHRVGKRNILDFENCSKKSLTLFEE